MDIVVYLALVVLGSVFLFSLFILIIICRRRYAYNHLLLTRSLRFSKLQQENLEDVELLGPHISRVLDHNQWIEIEAMTTGLLQHCVAVLKLCQTLAEQIAEISLSQQQQQQQQNHAELNEFICKSAARIVPRFEALLGSMAEKDMDIRVIEARVGALISTCWALIAPLSLASPKHKGQLMALVQQMDYHMASLQMALGKATELEEQQQQQQQQQVQVHLSDGAPSTSKQQNPEGERIANTTETDKLPPNGHVVHQHCDENERKAEPTTTTTDQSMTMTTTRERDGEKKSAIPMADEAPVADPAISR